MTSTTTSSTPRLGARVPAGPHSCARAARLLPLGRILLAFSSPSVSVSLPFCLLSHLSRLSSLSSPLLAFSSQFLALSSSSLFLLSASPVSRHLSVACLAFPFFTSHLVSPPSSLRLRASASAFLVSDFRVICLSICSPHGILNLRFCVFPFLSSCWPAQFGLALIVRPRVSSSISAFLLSPAPFFSLCVASLFFPVSSRVFSASVWPPHIVC